MLDPLTESSAWLALLQDTTLKRRLAKQVLHAWCVVGGKPLVDLLEQPADILRDQLSLTEEQAVQVLGIRPRLAEQRARLAALEPMGVRAVTRDAVGYPDLLAERLGEERAPYWMLCAGDLAVASQPGVAVLGASEPTAEAAALAADLARALVAEDHQLVGGFERGVDRLALQAGYVIEAVASVAVPVGLGRVESLLKSWHSGLEAGRWLVLSPYGPDQEADESTARGRMWLVAALSQALMLIAPTQRPEDLPWWAEWRTWGGQALIWAGSEAEVGRTWIEAGATPFADVEEAIRLLVGATEAPLAAPEASASQAAAPLPAVDNTPLEPFASPQEAMQALSKGGRVPERLRQRLAGGDKPVSS